MNEKRPHPPMEHIGATWWEHDARGIPLVKVCDACEQFELSKFRPDVLSDPDYWIDEPIEPEH